MGHFRGHTTHIRNLTNLSAYCKSYKSVLNLEKRYLHQKGIEFHQKLIGNQFRDVAYPRQNYCTIKILAFGLIGVVWSATVGGGTKKIYQRIVNNVNLLVLKLEKSYLHQNQVEYNHKLIWNPKLSSLFWSSISLPV